MQPESKQAILFFSLPRHDESFNSTSWQLAQEMAKENNVYFFDHPYTLKDLFKNWFTKTIRKRLLSNFTGCTSVINGVNVISSPFIFPVNFLPKGFLYDYISSFNEWIIARRINRILINDGIEEIHYINSFNFYFPEIFKWLKVNVLSNVYQCLDPIIKSYSAKHGSYLQSICFSQADAIVCTSAGLLQNINKEYLHKTHVLTNAVDFNHFNKKSIQAIRTLKKDGAKLAGYVGNIERRIDFQLLESVVKKLDTWHFLMAGPVELQYVPPHLLKHPRITWTGKIEYADIPNIMHTLDVALIPFKCDQVSNGIFPLKLYEYLAVGKPVVITPFNTEAFENLEDKKLIHIAYDAIDFATKIQESFVFDHDSIVASRIEEASKNTWKHRAKDLYDILKKYEHTIQQFSF